jgi:hypothetical protein
MTIGPDDIRKKRYEAADAYTTEELRRIYRGSDATARIRLLEQCAQDLIITPVALALWAATDEDQQVREWYARHGQLLDYYSQLDLAECIEKEPSELARRVQFASDLKNKPEFALLMLLLNDPDPFVRACLRENPAFLEQMGAEEAFNLSNHMERLALLRNPGLAPPWGEKAYGLLRSLLDPDDQILKISPEERKPLVLAYLANSSVERYFRLDSVLSLERWQTLNELVRKWGPGSGVPPGCLDVRYAFVLGEDETIAQFFPQCRDRYRKWMLLNAIQETGSASNYRKTLSAATSDPDAELRQMAYQLWPFRVYSEPRLANLSGPLYEEFAKYLASIDLALLKGLAGNPALSTEKHDKVLARLRELGVLKESEIALVGIADTHSVREQREAPLAGAEILFVRERHKKDADDWRKRFGNLGAVHEDLWEIDRKMNLLAEKILTTDSKMDKRISRLWAAAIAILVCVILLVFRLIL